MIHGLGIDMVEIVRIKRAIERWGDRFITRVFTQREIDHCFGRKNPHSCLALRLAAKEAFSKSIGLGMRKGIKWKDIEVVHDANGKPHINLHGETYRIYRDKALSNVHVSLTDESGWAVAAVILEH